MALKLIPPGKRGPFYIVRGTVNGRRIEVSTKTRDEEAARQFKKRLERQVYGGRAEGSAATFAEAVDLYAAWRNPSPQDSKTLERLKADALGKLPLAKVTTAAFVAAAGRLYPGLSNESKNRYVFVLGSAVMHYAAENELCPYRKFKRLPEKRPEARAIDAGLAEIAIEAATGDLKLLLTWLFRHGTRITETLGVHREWVDRKAKTVKIHDTKNDEWITIPLHPDVEALLPDEMGEGRLFPWKHRNTVYYHLEKLLTPLGFRFTPHQARHTFGTELVNMGFSLEPLPHWKDPKSRARYGRPTLSLQREIMGRLGEKRGRGRKAKRNQ